MHGGAAKSELAAENIAALTKGFENLKKHCETIEAFGLPYVVAVNKFLTDTEVELNTLLDLCRQNGMPAAVAEVWEKGGRGGLALAEEVLRVIEKGENRFKPLYDLGDSLEEKIRTIVQKVYGGKDVEFTSKAKKQLHEFEERGWGNLPVCMAKTQYSLSDDPRRVRPSERFYSDSKGVAAVHRRRLHCRLNR